MFHTSVRAMDSAADELQRQLRRLNQAIEGVEAVKNSLSGLSGMEAVRRDLDGILFDMEQERRKLSMLCNVLGQAARFYADCERNVIDYAECGRRHFFTPEWYEAELGSEAMGLAKQIIF